MVRVALLGAGFMGRMHGTCYSNIPEAKVVAVADKRTDLAKEIAAPHGAKVYGSADSVFRRDDIDMVDICLPTYMHAKYTIKAAQAGLSILCEKPMSHKVREARRMVEAVRAANVRFMCAHVIRFWPEYQVLKRYKDEGRLGQLLVLSCVRVSPKPTWTWEGWIVKHTLSGGALWDLHMHDTDFVRYLCGEPQKVDTVGVWSDESGWDYVFTNYHYPDMAVSAEGGWNMPSSFPFEMAYRAVFERGTLVFSCAKKPTLTLYKHDGTSEAPEVPQVGVGAAAGAGNISELGGYYNEIKYFVECVAQGKPTDMVPIEDSCATVELLQAEQKSAEKKR